MPKSRFTDEERIKTVESYINNEIGWNQIIYNYGIANSTLESWIRKWVFFMYHKQANKTAIQSQHMITDALFSLMKRKPFQQITVTEICEEANLGRKTFYRNFDLREDVIDFWLDLRCEECRELLLPVPTEEQLCHYCIFLKKYMDELIVLYQNGLHPQVEKKFSIFLPYTMPLWSEDPVEQEYRSQYITAGIDAIIRVWVARGFQESVEGVVEIVKRAQKAQVPLRQNKNATIVT